MVGPDRTRHGSRQATPRANWARSSNALPRLALSWMAGSRRATGSGPTSGHCARRFRMRTGGSALSPRTTFRCPCQRFRHSSTSAMPGSARSCLAGSARSGTSETATFTTTSSRPRARRVMPTWTSQRTSPGRFTTWWPHAEEASARSMESGAPSRGNWSDTPIRQSWRQCARSRPLLIPLES